MKKTPLLPILAISRQLPIVMAIAASLWLCACNSGGSGGGTGTNTPPVVNAGADQTVNRNASVQLSGTGSDAEGAVNFSWAQTAGPAVVLSDAHIANPVFTAPDVSTSAEIIFALTVTDSAGVTARDEVQVAVSADASPGNTSPLVDAGANQAVNEGVVVQLAGTGSDAEGGVTFAWTQIAGPVVTLSSTTIANPTFSAPSVDATTTIQLRLTVTDTANADTADTVDIAVNNVASGMLPAAAAVTVSYGIKQVVLNWGAANGATYYRVLKNPDGASGYTQLGADLTATTYADTVAVHLTDWLNASYIVAACNNAGCTDSAAILGFDATQAIGYFKASNTVIGSPFNGSHFGVGLALSADGSTLAVGAPDEYSGATGINGNQTADYATMIPASGAVYVFTRSGGTWVQQAYVKPSNTRAVASFGQAVALSADGSTLAVGAPKEMSAATGINGDQAASGGPAGAVYVFSRSGNSWSQQAYVKASTRTRNVYGGFFGYDVALSADGNTMAVGSHTENSASTGINGREDEPSSLPTYTSGAAYVFTRSGSTWSQQAYVKASNSSAGDAFGCTVALSSDGNTLAVSAIFEDSAATGINGSQTDDPRIDADAGAVYVFTRTSGTWSQQAYVKSSNAGARFQFGFGLALSGNGDVMAVSTTAETSPPPDTRVSGAVYVFSRSGGVWSQQAYLKASNTSAGASTAVALSTDGKTLVAGWRENSIAGNIPLLNSGAAYVFVHNGSAWSQRAYVKASNEGDGDEFGSAVAVSGDGSTLAVAAPHERSAATGINGLQSDNTKGGAGAVYLY